MLTELDYFDFTISVTKNEVSRYVIAGRGIVNFIKFMDSDGKNYIQLKHTIDISLYKDNKQMNFRNLNITSVEEKDNYKIIELRAQDGTMKIKYKIEVNEWKPKTMEVSYYSHIEF